MSDLTKYAKGKRMVREDLIKEIGENTAELKKKVSSYKADNITSLTSDFINNLKAGDIVLKKTGEQYHAYVVSFKKDDEGICLTYTDASIVETVSYDLVGTTWTYNSTDKTKIGEFKKVVANPTLAGTEDDLEGIQIGTTKYKVGGGNLYLHNILVKFSNADTNYRFGFQIYTNSSTKIESFNDLKPIILARGIQLKPSADTKYIPTYGSISALSSPGSDYTNTNVTAIGVRDNNSWLYFLCNYVTMASSGDAIVKSVEFWYTSNDTPYVTYSDTVTQII